MQRGRDKVVANVEGCRSEGSMRWPGGSAARSHGMPISTALPAAHLTSDGSHAVTRAPGPGRA